MELQCHNLLQNTGGGLQLFIGCAVTNGTECLLTPKSAVVTVCTARCSTEIFYVLPTQCIYLVWISGAQVVVVVIDGWA